MHHPLFSLALLLLVAALTAACTHSVTSPSTRAGSSSAPDSIAQIPGQLEGSWTLASIQRAGEAQQDRPLNATYTLTFAAGRISTRADCNSCGGTFSISGTTLTTASALACTRAACPTMAYENAYVTILGGDSEIVVTGSTLTLSSPRGTLRLVRN